MSSINLGNQVLTFDYKHPAKAYQFNTLLQGLINNGVYTGGQITITGNDTISVAPFVAFIQFEDNKGLRVETRSTVNLTLTEDPGYNTVISITYTWQNVIENWADWHQRSSNDTALQYEVILGECTWAGGVLSTVTYANKTWGKRLVSTVDDGFAPIVVESTTVCPNLNADMLDGAHLSTDVTFSANSDTLVPSQKAVKKYIADNTAFNQIISGSAALAVSSINYISGSAQITLTLPTTSVFGKNIKIFDTTGFGYKLKKGTSQTKLTYNNTVSSGIASNKIKEYLVSTYTYSVADLVCAAADIYWQELIPAGFSFVKGKGYHLGGLALTAVIENLNFTDETSAAISATLDTAKYNGCGLSGPLKGYILGGYTTVVITVIEDLNFATETSAAIGAALDTAKQGGAGVYSETKGFYLGGTTGSVVAVIEDFNFSSETSAAIVATLDTAKTDGVGVSGTTKGYILGGWIAASTNVIEDFVFAAETSAAISATLDTAKCRGAGIHSDLKGYIVGGWTTAVITVIEDINFTTETSAAIGATLNTAKADACGVSGATKGYAMGGTTGSAVNIIEDLNFALQSSDVISATLDTVRYDGTGLQGNY